MNSRQAINLLKGLEQSLDDYCELNDEGKTAFRMGITALELFGNAEQLPSIQPNTTTHDSIPAETGENDGDGTSGDCISRQVVAKFLDDWLFCLDENCHKQSASDLKMIIKDFKNLPSAQPERKTGHWILDRSGAYCCSKCMEPCATYAMMKPRDKFCKMCGSRNEVTE